MAARNSFWTRPYLFVQIHGGDGLPYAVRLTTKKLVGAALFVGFVVLALGAGSLLFFREREMSRKLTERVLGFETTEKLSRQIQVASRTLAASAPTEGPRGTKGSREALPPAPKTVTAAVEPARPPATVASAPATSEPAKTAPAPGVVTARIADLSVTCLEETCSGKISMVPAANGIAQGELLVILETEVPRIGSANPGSTIRRRYFLYPGYQTRDDLNPTQLDQISRKTFRFSRALQTSVTFNIGKLLRPLALNVYTYDASGQRIHHERRQIESEVTP